MVLAAFQSTITDDAGNVVPGASIEVRTETPGLPLVQVYSDRDGLVVLGNPYVSSDGHVLFYAEGGSYRIKATSDGLIRELHNVAIGTAAESDIDELAALLSDMVNDTSPQLGGLLDTNGHQVRLSQGADVASASELILGNDGNAFNVTGDTDVDSIAGKRVGTIIKLQALGVFALNHSADLICPGGASITTAVGDEVELRQYAVGQWKITNFLPANRFLNTGSQLARVEKTDSFVTTSTSYVDLPGLNVSATVAAGQKISVRGNISLSASASNFVHVRLVRDGTPIGLGDSVGLRVQSTSTVVPFNGGASIAIFDVEDTPGAGTFTYKVQIKTSSAIAYVNQNDADTNSSIYYRTRSSLVAYAV